jgi:hypothetical protein
VVTWGLEFRRKMWTGSCIWEVASIKRVEAERNVKELPIDGTEYGSQKNT